MELAFACFLFLPLLFLLLSSVWEKTKLPPGPWKLPLIGSIHHLVGSLPHHRLRDLATKYGPIMHLQLGEIPAVVISSPRVAKEVLKTHDLAFSNRPELLATKIVFYNTSDIVFSQYGDYWRQMRKICILELLGTKNVRSFSEIREEEVSRLVETIKLSSSVGVPIDLSHKIFLFNSSVTCRAAFGKVCRDQNRLLQLMKQTALCLGGFDVADIFPSWKALHILSGMKPKLLRLHRQLDIILENIIIEHKKNLALTGRGSGESGDHDLVDVLVKLNERGDLQFPITNDNINSVIFDMFAAGSETSSAAIVWAMSEMLRNPTTMSKAQAEIRHVLKGKTTFNLDDVQDLKYLHMVIKETMRLHPPNPLIPRVCREEAVVDGYTIPVKTKILVNIWAIGRDPDYWCDPERFQPERFSDGSIDF